MPETTRTRPRYCAICRDVLRLDAAGEMECQRHGQERKMKHFRVVNDDGSGSSMFSISTREMTRTECELAVMRWLRPGYHVEVHEQTYYVTDSFWRRIDLLSWSCELERHEHCSGNAIIGPEDQPAAISCGCSCHA